MEEKLSLKFPSIIWNCFRDHKMDLPDFFCVVHKSLGTIRSVQPLTQTSEEHLLNILHRMEHFYNVHGISIRTAYEDFDVHHIGTVTESQVDITVLISFIIQYKLLFLIKLFS